MAVGVAQAVPKPADRNPAVTVFVHVGDDGGDQPSRLYRFALAGGGGGLSGPA